MARPISHERRSTERLCMLDTGLRARLCQRHTARWRRVISLALNTPPRARYLCAIREGIHKRSCLFDKYDFFPKSTSPTDGNAIFECYIGLL